MATQDPEVADYAREKTDRSMARFALRRMRVLVDKDAAESAAMHRFTVRALLWFVTLVLTVPVLLFGAGAVRAYLEYRGRGRPLAVFVDRFLLEFESMAFRVAAWTVAVCVLFLHHRAARQAKKAADSQPSAGDSRP
jgi:hypothetical protein